MNERKLYRRIIRHLLLKEVGYTAREVNRIMRTEHSLLRAYNEWWGVRKHITLTEWDENFPECDQCNKNDKVICQIPYFEWWCDRCDHGWMGPA